jgi:hypothetical protein
MAATNAGSGVIDDAGQFESVMRGAVLMQSAF